MIKKTTYAFCLVISLSVTGQTYDLTQGLLLHLSFDNSFEDGSIYNHLIQEHFGPIAKTTDRNGATDKAFLFNGINQSLELDYLQSNADLLDFGADDFSIGFWVKKQSPIGNNYDNSAGLNKWESGASLPTSEWSFNIAGGNGVTSEAPNFFISLNGNTLKSVVATNTDVVVGQWTHLMVTRTNTNLEIYVDGNLKGTTDIGTAAITDANRDLLIARSYLNGLYTEAAFDDIVFYDKALTPAEIAELMTYGVTTGNSGGNTTAKGLWSDDGNGNLFYDQGKVSVGVNYNNAGYELAVKGVILAEGVKVTTYPNWPDYVFDPGFNLLPLDELERFIVSNRHLPGIPSAVSVLNHGFSLEKMDATLLKKIEELTLYTINQEKKIENQAALIDKLMKRLEKLEKK